MVAGALTCQPPPGQGGQTDKPHSGCGHCGCLLRKFMPVCTGLFTDVLKYSFLVQLRLLTPEFWFLPEQFHKGQLPFPERTFCVGKHPSNFTSQTPHSCTYSDVQADTSPLIKTVVILAHRYILEGTLERSLLPAKFGQIVPE